MNVQALEDYQPLIVLALIVTSTLLETARPLVESEIPRWRHARRNLGMTVLAFVGFAGTAFLKAGSSKRFQTGAPSPTASRSSMRTGTRR